MQTNTNYSEVDRIEFDNLVGAAYEEIKAAAEAAYWVAPILTDNPAFEAHYRLVETAQSGLVHYRRR